MRPERVPTPIDTGTARERMIELRRELSITMNSAGSLTPRQMLEKFYLLLRLVDTRLAELEGLTAYIKALGEQRVEQDKQLSLRARLERWWRRFRRG